MARILDTQAFLDTVCDLLRQGEHAVPIPVVGSSMVPFLVNGDTVYLDVPDTPIKRGDILLYTRASGMYVLHRVFRVNPDGSFLMVGDAQTELERLPSRDQIHARVTWARHKGKVNRPGQLRWWAYRTLWLRLLPLRPLLMNLREKLR
jgi:hypothetical protein